MFVPDFEKSIPGYTGHRPSKHDGHEDLQQAKEPRKHIPGYGGYVPSVTAENVFGQSYGKTSYQATAKAIVKGRELPPHLNYVTSMKQEFIDHSQRAG
jgi:hypothetical protein